MPHKRISILSVLIWALPVVVLMLMHQWVPNWPALRFVNRYLVHIMFGTLALGLIGLALRFNYFMFSAFVTCAMLCVYMKVRTGNSFESINAVYNGPMLSVLHINLSAVPDTGILFSTIRVTQSDLLSFQELTPDWAPLLDTFLADLYPFSAKRQGFDLYSMAIYGRNAFTDIDTIRCNDGFWLALRYPFTKSDTLTLLDCYLMPYQGSESEASMQKQLNILGRSVNSLPHPLLVVGDFNLMPWSDELLQLRSLTNLRDSRNSYRDAPFYKKGYTFDVPLDYVYYSSDWVCKELYNIGGGKNGHLGLLGIFQLKTASGRDKKSNK